MAYLDTAGINTGINAIAAAHPGLAQVVILPEKSVKNKTIRALRLRAGSAVSRRGALIVGGVHARELVNPEAVLNLAVKLTDSYAASTGFNVGGKTFTWNQVKLTMETLDVFLLPLANPDGREHVQKPGGYPMWRKNRANLAGTGCIGVDLNRNLDFLWFEVLGATSDVPCDDTFHGPASFSEPETRNIKWLLDSHPHIRCFADVHSYSELILYPWGDDDAQSADSSQSFLNPVWNGLRGTAGGYAEHMVSKDVTRHHKTGEAIRDAIAAVRGRSYTVEPSIDLYPTTGTHMDYSYSRHLARPDLGKVYAFTFETGREFQPAEAEKLEVIKEATAGMMQLLVHCICAIDLIGVDLFGAQRLDDMRRFRDEVMTQSVVGRSLIEVLDEHSAEVGELLLADDRLRSRATKLLEACWNRIESGRTFDARIVGLASKLIEDLRPVVSPELRRSLDRAAKTAVGFKGKRVEAGLKVKTDWMQLHQVRSGESS